MDYNQFTYYRANPYARQGFIPPIAHTNRHRPDFVTEMPMGQQHLGKIGKKFFTSNGKQVSNIQKEHLLESPQRYPYENRIALDKNYERNLNTIDIEGSTSGTMMTQGVRNKLKARQALIRRQKQQQGKYEDNLIHLKLTEEQKRRQVAHQQQQRNEMRMSRLTQGMQDKNIGNNKHNNFDFNPYQQNNYHNTNNGGGRQYRYSIDSRAHQAQDANQNMNRYQENQERRIQNKEPRYQSIEIGRPSHNPEENSKNSIPPPSGSSLSRSVVNNNQPKLPMPKDKYEHRLQNPTNLSYETSLFRAGKNLLNNN